MSTRSNDPFKALLFCFIGPGASGKSSICQALLNSDLPLMLSISTTTRAPRGTEKNGTEYFFTNKETFEKEVSDGLFLEHAEFAGNLYGTKFDNITAAERMQKHVLLDIEINGVINLKKVYPDRVVVTFVCTPTLSELRKRFEIRGVDSEDRIEERMNIARDEIRRALGEGISDYIIVNDDLKNSIDSAKSIIRAEQIKRTRVNFNPLV